MKSGTSAANWKSETNMNDIEISDDLRIGFLGAGKMATALAQGFLNAGIVKPENMRASDVIAEAREAFEQTTETVCGSNSGIASFADVVFIAVKPHFVIPVLQEISEHVDEETLIVSIAAGIQLATIEEQLPTGTHVIRVMPNTPALVGVGASAYSKGTSTSDHDLSLVKKLLSTVGIAHEVPEHLLNGVTGLSGSGPAYVFQFIEALSDGGVAAGLPRNIATELAAQTVLGAARLLLETGKHPGELKDAVASPGGTTIAGLHELEKAGFRGATINAVIAAARRSEELA